MDLRKTVLLKKPLRDSFNSSNNSVYESANEDSDTSLYFSFTDVNSSNKSSNNCNEIEESSSMNITNDKENTVIMMKMDEQKAETEEKKMEFSLKAGAIKMDENGKDEEIHCLQVPEIKVEDPNMNLINPFTATEAALSLEIAHELNSKNFEPNANLNVSTKSKIQEMNKKSVTKIPTKAHFYSPIQRTSLDKKVISKPLQRRTVYEARSSTISTRSSTSKPVAFKCTHTGCLREFRTESLLKNHVKLCPSIRPSTSASAHQRHKCTWCDKVFEISAALTCHMLEKCPKITFAEKRKLLSEQEKSKQDKRRTVFVAPTAPRKRSPMRKTINNGISIIPKKAIKCNCGVSFMDACEYANHMVGHKYENLLNKKAK